MFIIQIHFDADLSASTWDPFRFPAAKIDEGGKKVYILANNGRPALMGV